MMEEGHSAHCTVIMSGQKSRQETTDIFARHLSTHYPLMFLMLFNLKFEIRLALLRQSLYHAHIARSANQYSISNASGGKNSNNCGVDFVFPSETFDSSGCRKCSPSTADIVFPEFTMEASHAPELIQNGFRTRKRCAELVRKVLQIGIYVIAANHISKN